MTIMTTAAYRLAASSMASPGCTLPPKPFQRPWPNPRFFMPSKIRVGSRTKARVRSLFDTILMILRDKDKNIYVYHIIVTRADRVAVGRLYIKGIGSQYPGTFNSLRPGDGMWRQTSWSISVQIMGSRLLRAKLLRTPMLTY